MSRSRAGLLTDHFLALLSGGLTPPPEGADASELAAADEARIAATAAVFRLAEYVNIHYAVNTQKPGKVSRRKRG